MIECMRVRRVETIWPMIGVEIQGSRSCTNRIARVASTKSAQRAGYSIFSVLCTRVPLQQAGARFHSVLLAVLSMLAALLHAESRTGQSPHGPIRLNPTWFPTFYRVAHCPVYPARGDPIDVLDLGAGIRHLTRASPVSTYN